MLCEVMRLNPPEALWVAMLMLEKRSIMWFTDFFTELVAAKLLPFF
jgi:hypothetical protein